MYQDQILYAFNERPYAYEEVAEAHMYAHENGGARYWSQFEKTGSLLEEFQSNPSHDSYKQFIQSCQKFADDNGYTLVEASQKIHNVFSRKG